MYDHTQGKYQRDNLKEPSSAASATDAERRTVDRHAFIATAEVVELKSGARLATRTTDLGLGGCFVDMLIPFETGTKVQVRILKDTAQLDADGTVTYAQAGLGMGIAFNNLGAEQEQTLCNWIGKEVSEPAQPTTQETTAPQRPDNPNRAVLARLVQLMVGKGLLTAEEGASLSEDLPRS